MTEEQLREPPLLSAEEVFDLLGITELPKADDAIAMLHADFRTAGKIAQTQRDICIKWMKEHCYLKAERELPEVPMTYLSADTFNERVAYQEAQQDMLKEVEGVAYRPSRKFKNG